MDKKSIIYLSIIAFLIFCLMKCNNDLGDERKHNKGLQDNLKTYKDKYNRSVTELESEKVSKKQLKKALDSLKLTKKADKVTIVKTETNFTTPIKTILSYDTVKINDTIKVYPTYTAKYRTKWYRGEIVASYDSIRPNLKFINQLSFTEHQKNARSKVYVTATNENPNTINVGVKQYALRPKRQIIMFKPNVSVGYDVLRGQLVPLHIGYGANIDIEEVLYRLRLKK